MPSKGEEFVHDQYTRKAMDLVRKGQSFFITGKAGTGKTMLLKKIVQECRARGKNIAVTAPTGIAAKNAEGKTLHSMFGLKTHVFIPWKTTRWYRLDTAREIIIKNLDILIIDEISMVRCDVLDMVDHVLKRIKKNKKPFGGIQVVFFGDLFQLPPVVTEDEEDILYSHYDNQYFFSSDVIKKTPFPVLELNNVHRQRDDAFINILNNIREGKYLSSDRDELNKRYKPGYEPSEKESSIYLRTINDKVNAHNYSKLKNVPGDEKIFWGDFEGKYPRKQAPTEEKLRLKEGAKVMLLRNDNDNYDYVNGTQGVVKSIYGGVIRIKTDDGKLISVERSKWEVYDYIFNEETKTIDPISVGSFTQYPIKLAWAVTIHKSQGMTFDKAIVDARKSFAPGQVYVALSRCRSLDGLTLTSRITEDDIKVDPIVVSYMKGVDRIIPNETDANIEMTMFYYAENGKVLKGINSEISGNVVIPEGVERIAEEAFMDNTNITSVVCPSSLREIENNAFMGCVNLCSVTLNDGLESIGQEAFLDTDLNSVEIPYTVEDMGLTPFDCAMKVYEISLYYSDVDGVLYDKTKSSLILYPRKIENKKIEIPLSVISINAYAFECNNAEEIILPENIFSLGGYLFNGCQNLKTLTIKQELPDLITIEEDTFKGFEIENCVLCVPTDALSEYLNDDRFKDFKYITAIEGSRCLKYDPNGTEVIGCEKEDCENIVIPEGITSVKECAFEDNDSIESVVFPDSMLTIGNKAFSGCINLYNVKLNDDLETIDWDAFRGTDLSSILIPYNVNEIGYSAFNCEIEVDSLNTDFCAHDGVLYSYDEDELVIYPADKIDEEFEVPFTVEKIGGFAFEDTCLKKLTLPDSIKDLGMYIFADASYLKTLIIQVPDPNDINIDEEAFESFNKKQCKLIVPDGCSSMYALNKHFKDFMTISEEPESEFITGQKFDKLPGTYYSEGKSFCYFEGYDRCCVVLSSKGFFLKLANWGYYYMSDLINGSVSGKIWVKNKRGSATSYSVAYTTDNENYNAFGRFTESVFDKKLSYKDNKSERSFTIDIKTGKVDINH